MTLVYVSLIDDNVVCVGLSVCLFLSIVCLPVYLSSCRSLKFTSAEYLLQLLSTLLDRVPSLIHSSTILASQLVPRNLCFCPPSAGIIGSQHPRGFKHNVDSGSVNSGPCVCMVGTLPIEPSLHLNEEHFSLCASFVEKHLFGLIACVDLLIFN